MFVHSGDIKVENWPSSAKQTHRCTHRVTWSHKQANFLMPPVVVAGSGIKIVDGYW